LENQLRFDKVTERNFFETQCSSTTTTQVDLRNITVEQRNNAEYKVQTVVK